MFPLGEPLFSSLGPDGLSMFYISCIVSQLVYSLGGSAFVGGVGSEMVGSPKYLKKKAANNPDRLKSFRSSIKWRIL